MGLTYGGPRNVIFSVPPVAFSSKRTQPVLTISSGDWPNLTSVQNH
jgi:hypothetical protein